jgi:hypothetical protein
VDINGRCFGTAETEEGAVFFQANFDRPGWCNAEFYKINVDSLEDIKAARQQKDFLGELLLVGEAHYHRGVCRVDVSARNSSLLDLDRDITLTFRRSFLDEELDLSTVHSRFYPRPDTGDWILLGALLVLMVLELVVGTASIVCTAAPRAYGRAIRRVPALEYLSLRYLPLFGAGPEKYPGSRWRCAERGLCFDVAEDGACRGTAETEGGPVDFTAQFMYLDGKPGRDARLLRCDNGEVLLEGGGRCRYGRCVIRVSPEDCGLWPLEEETALTFRREWLPEAREKT